jgi:hypothetical protein
VTVAVNVTGWPGTDGFALDARDVLEDLRAPDTVNVAEAESPSASFAVTVFPPDTDVGTASVAEKEPEESVDTLDGMVVTVVPSYVIETADDGAYPEPETVNVLPTVPLVGNSVTVGVRDDTICTSGDAVLSL